MVLTGNKTIAMEVGRLVEVHSNSIIKITVITKSWLK
jgi:hypothetical protein